MWAPFLKCEKTREYLKIISKAAFFLEDFTAYQIQRYSILKYFRTFKVYKVYKLYKVYNISV